MNIQRRRTSDLMSTQTEDSIRLAEMRSEHLGRVTDAYEISDEGMPDCTVPGAAAMAYSEFNGVRILRSHPRFVLLTQYGDKDNYRVYLARDQANVEQLARLAVCDGESIICYFDLDQLVGKEPLAYEGDIVQCEDHLYTVAHVDEELIEGEIARYLCLNEVDKIVGGWDDYDRRESDGDVEVVESVEPDERMPMRYELARIAVSVVFNTIPSPT